MCVEVKFISIPNILMKEISHVLEKYQIKVDRFFDRNYINNFSALEELVNSYLIALEKEV